MSDPEDDEADDKLTKLQTSYSSPTINLSKDFKQFKHNLSVDYMLYDDDDTEESRSTTNYHEPSGEWIECQELVSGRHLFYNSITMEIIFDNNPVINKKKHLKNSKNNASGSDDDEFEDDMLAEDITDNQLVSRILKFDKLKWEFDNNAVDIYRLQCNDINHTLMLPHPVSMSFPEFFSTNTIPKEKHFVAQILPPKDNTLFPTTSKQWKVRVIVQETTAKQLIDKIVEKKLKTSLVSEYDGDTVICAEFILKVVGCEEYILYDDTKLIVDYEAVRKAVRNEDDVVFQLDHRPDLPLIEQECFDKNIWHIMQFKNKYLSAKLLTNKTIQKHADKETRKYCKYSYGDGMSLNEIMLAKKHNGFTKPYQLYQNQLILSSQTKLNKMMTIQDGMDEDFDEYKTNLHIFLDDIPPPPPPTITAAASPPATIDEPLPSIKHSFKYKNTSICLREEEHLEESDDDSHTATAEEVPPPPPLLPNAASQGNPKGSFTSKIIMEDVAAEIKIDDNRRIMNVFASQMKVLNGKEILQNIPSLKDTQFLLKTIPKKVDQIKAGLPIKEMLLHEFAQFYRVKMSFLTNVTHLPRYKHYISSISSKNIKKLVIIVRHELWIGDLKYNTTTFDTDGNTKICDGMRFGNAVFAQSKQKWCDLARESCISFTVLLCDSAATTDTDKKIKLEMPIAFVRLPIVDARNLLRDGKYALNLWPIPVYIALYKGAKCDPYINLAFRYRGSTTDRHFKQIKKKRHSKIDKLTGMDLEDKALQNIFKLGIEFEQRKFKIIAPPLNHRINYKAAHLKKTARELSRRETLSLSQLSKEKEKENGKGAKRKSSSSSFMRIFSTKKEREHKESENKAEEWRRVHEIVISDLLYKYSERDKQLLWKYRSDLCKMPNALNCFLASIDWRDADIRSETYDLIEAWTPSPYLEDSLELLSYEFMDNYVREYAIMRLAAMHDSDLQRYLLQLVQCLKYELHHNNGLIRLLMRRSIANPNQIGHFFFWHIKSEYLQDDELNIMYLERFGVYLEEYLLFSQLGVPRDIFLQCNLCRELGKINSSLRLKAKSKKKDVTKADLKQFLHGELAKLNSILPNTFILPINPRWRCTSFVIAECKTMDSAQLPLWLSLKNIDDSVGDQNTIIMFKTGDDLRQDILTLQILRIMDKIWLDRGLNLRLLPYNVVSTGNGQGMVEIVLNAKTTTYIHTNYGGGPQKGARDITTHLKYLRHVNNAQIVCVKKARDIYSRSCAGYCIASYVLGLGDRHPSNIMVRQKGELFHIDFSHFLGNFKSQNIIGDYVKWQREVAPFVFLPAYKYCINNGNKDAQKYDEFVQFAVNAYLALRQRHRLLINLFILMLPSQMPELIQKKHIHYLRNQLHLDDVKNDCVYKHILKIIKVCLNDKRRIIDNTFHAIKHQ